MKSLQSAPKERAFFDVYARLARSIKASGLFAQIVSGLTEVGGIYAAAYTALLPVFPTLALYFAAAVAIIGTAIIELGLRVLAPQTVDAILYRRYKGLHLAMTISIWLLTAVLFTASGLLSFRNSKTIVNEFTPEATEQTTAQADSIYQAEAARLASAWANDSARIVEQYAAQITAAQTAGAGKVNAAKRELSNWYNRERRTGDSYGTQKDRARQLIADREAEAAAALAALKAQEAEALSTARNDYKAALGTAQADRRTAAGEVKAANEAAAGERAATVAAYGGGLGWFTVICLLVFAASVVLDRIHRKGSGITETVELSQYDVNPPALVEAWEALRERVQYALRSKITAFAEKTPAAPLPARPAELYDPTQLANIVINLQVEGEDDDNTIYIQPKRRQIGFKTAGTDPEAANTSRALYNARTPHTKHEPEAPEQHTKSSYETPDLRHLKQRLKEYKKRLGKHQQKALRYEKEGKPVPKRTAAALDNNAQWVEHYANLIDQAEATKRKA